MSENPDWRKELGSQIEELHGEDARRALEPLLDEIHELVQGPIGEGLILSACEGLGRNYMRWAGSLANAVRIVLHAGRSLRDHLDRSGDLDDTMDRRLTILVAEAASEVAGWVEKSQSQRREAWLSYLTHEIKNPLNTILNALWLLREKGGDPAQALRFLEMAERAVRRIEGRVREVRTLDEHLHAVPPGWESRLTER
jgi:signal transduction histidine kinase